MVVAVETAQTALLADTATASNLVQEAVRAAAVLALEVSETLSAARLVAADNSVADNSEEAVAADTRHERNRRRNSNI